MEIIQTTKITLEDAEMSALETLETAYDQCVIDECFDCDVCPLYSYDGCVASYAKNVLEKLKRGK